MPLTEISSYKTWGGYQKIFSHDSKELACKMQFAIFLPRECEDKAVPVIYWLPGIQSRLSDFTMKISPQRYASFHGVMLVCPDTSPKGLNLPGEKDLEVGEGAGFYLNATQHPWNTNFRMFSYVTSELISIINKNFPTVKGKQSIMGHCMGGHGALICALKNPGLYKSVSAFAPICNPMIVPWGIKAFTNYLGPVETGNWHEWDATEIIKSYTGKPIHLFIDQGTADLFLINQLLPDNIMQACRDANLPAHFAFREGYDHSYYYVSSFIGEHIAYHVQFLNDQNTIIN